MKTEKKIQVVMLATNKESILHLFTGNKKGLYLYPENMSVIPRNPHCLNQHLYFLSDDKIKGGDWYYNLEVKKIFKQSGTLSDRVVMSSHNSHYIENCRKIISSTDKSLGLPEPSKEWIEYFISQYNQSNIITEVIIEYEKGSYDDWIKTAEPVQDKLKVNPDITINIKMEETWDDVFELYRKSLKLGELNKPITDFLQKNYQVPKQINK